MEKAVAHARHHKNISAAARQFHVPKSTLHDMLSGRISVGAKVGHPTALSAKEEAEIEETCVIFAEWGFGLGRREVEGVIQSCIKSTNRKNIRAHTTT